MQLVVGLLEEYDQREKKSLKTIAELHQEAKKQNLMKNDLLAKLQKSQGDLTQIREALSSNFSKAQIDRIVSARKTHWKDEDYSNAVVLLGLSPKGYKYNFENCFVPL